MAALNQPDSAYRDPHPLAPPAPRHEKLRLSIHFYRSCFPSLPLSLCFPSLFCLSVSLCLSLPFSCLPEESRDLLPTYGPCVSISSGYSVWKIGNGKYRRDRLEMEDNEGESSKRRILFRDNTLPSDFLFPKLAFV